MSFSHYVLWAAQVRLRYMWFYMWLCSASQASQTKKSKKESAKLQTGQRRISERQWPDGFELSQCQYLVGCFLFGCHKTGLPCWFLSFYMWLALDQQPPRFGKWRKWKESENREKWLISSQRNNALPTVLQMWRSMQKSKICSCMRCAKKEASVPVCFAITIPRDQHWDFFGAGWHWKIMESRCDQCDSIFCHIINHGITYGILEENIPALRSGAQWLPGASRRCRGFQRFQAPLAQASSR